MLVQNDALIPALIRAKSVQHVLVAFSSKTRHPALMTPFPITRLDHVARYTDWLEIACRQCGRYGRLRVARLIAERGPGGSVWDVVTEARSDCPAWRQERAGERVSIYEICQACCPTLGRIGK